jgi:hypothetical protein
MLVTQKYLPEQYKKATLDEKDQEPSTQSLQNSPLKKKKQRQMFLLVLLAIVLLSGGIVSYVLMKQNQDIRQSASEQESDRCDNCSTLEYFKFVSIVNKNQDGKNGEWGEGRLIDPLTGKEFNNDHTIRATASQQAIGVRCQFTKGSPGRTTNLQGQGTIVNWVFDDTSDSDAYRTTKWLVNANATPGKYDQGPCAKYKDDRLGCNKLEEVCSGPWYICPVDNYAPTEVAPAGTITDGVRNITWKGQTGAESYTVRVTNTQTNQVEEFSVPASSTSYSYNFASATNYSIGVSAKYYSDCGTSEFTTTTLTTGSVVPTIDIPNPTFTPTQPASPSATATNTPTPDVTATPSATPTSTNTPTPPTGTVTATYTPTVVVATATPTPQVVVTTVVTNVVTTVGCNESCSANADCSNVSHICYQGRCRLDVNPDDAQCKLASGDTVVRRTVEKVEYVTGPEDWMNYLKLGIGALGLGALLLLLL